MMRRLAPCDALEPFAVTGVSGGPAPHLRLGLHFHVSRQKARISSRICVEREGFDMEALLVGYLTVSFFLSAAWVAAMLWSTRHRRSD